MKSVRFLMGYIWLGVGSVLGTQKDWPITALRSLRGNKAESKQESSLYKANRKKGWVKRNKVVNCTRIQTVPSHILCKV
jgi:hypothetical protein